jgi:hypothetical protein
MHTFDENYDDHYEFTEMLVIQLKNIYFTKGGCELRFDIKSGALM